MSQWHMSYKHRKFHHTNSLAPAAIYNLGVLVSDVSCLTSSSKLCYGTFPVQLTIDRGDPAGGAAI